jgi:hypothetical protein
MNLKPVSIFQVLRTSAALLAFGGHAVLALAQGGPAVVGEATMVIGQASLVGADGATRPVARGESIRAGDRIETQAGGHVHVRFVDGGRLSVRPSSRLHVENYAHSDQQPQMSAIRFRLEEGVVRSITGAWGEASRDRFRLNTPVAAIGIKGTDFVVKADAGATAASVYSGAIMLSPLSEGCGSTLGPCLNGNEKLLSEDMKGFMLELSKGQGAPQLVAAVDLMAGARKPGAPVSVAGVSASQVPTVEGAPRQGGGTDKMVVGETLAAEAVQLAWFCRPGRSNL